MGVFDAAKPDPKVDMCRCDDCGVTWKIADCLHDYGHHDGWEMPAYTEILCPSCEDGGCIADFWPSSEC